MRKHHLYMAGSVLLGLWIATTYFLFVHRPTLQHKRFEVQPAMEVLKERISSLEVKLREQNELNAKLREQVNMISAVRTSKWPVVEKISSSGERRNPEFKDFHDYEIPKKDHDFPSEVSHEREKNVRRVKKEDMMPILMFACNRPSVSKALNSLLRSRTDKEKFPIIVSQDCGHKETKDVLLGFKDEIILMEQPNQSDVPVPKKEIKFKGYFKIARHYGWALNETFNQMGYSQVIIVEDDLEFSPDFYHYFESTLPLLRNDSSLFCVSAWNDNGKEHLIDETHPERLYRTDFFGGLGWMLTQKLWGEELSRKWPKSYWDDWMRDPAQRKGRACIRPEISRTKTFGKIGVSNGLFYNTHLKFIKLYDKAVDFKSRDLTYLRKSVYDSEQDKLLDSLPVVSIEDLKTGQVAGRDPVRVIYHNKLAFKKIAKVLGIMDDFKSGVPRMAYRGVVSTMFKDRRIYVAPNVNWQGYDPTW